MITKEREQQEIRTNDEAPRADHGQLKKERQTSSNTLLTMGIIEIIIGVLAMVTPAFSSIAFVLLLGSALVIGGILEIIASIARSNFVLLFVGAITIVAGFLAIAQPLAGLGFLTFLIASYLVLTGVGRLFGRDRPTWTRVGGAIGIILGIIVFIFFSSISPVLLGIFVGVNLLIDGIIAAQVSLDMRQAYR